MSIEFMKEFLLGCIIVNYGILLIWFGVFVFARTWIFNLHTRWFSISRETFYGIHYGGMAVYKIGILLFNLAPLIVLCFFADGL